MDDADIICQSGVRWEDINNTLQEKNIPLFFPVSVPNAHIILGQADVVFEFIQYSLILVLVQL